MSDTYKGAVTFQVLTNLTCNLDCTYCYEHNKTRGKNDINKIKKYLDIKFGEIKGVEKDVFIEFIGGESFLHPDLMDEVMEYAIGLNKERGNSKLDFQVSTNGTLLGEPAVRALIKKYWHELHIGVSIDGKKEMHDKNRMYLKGRGGSYDDIIKNLPWLFKNAHVCNLGVKATFIPDTIDHYAESVIHLFELGFPFVGANFAFEYKYTKEHSIRILRELYKVVDYMMENNLDKTHRLAQLNFEFENILKYNIDYLTNMNVERDRNYCGSCLYMSCIGFDDEVYGCNRFCTMDKGKSLFNINDKEGTFNKTLYNEAVDQWKLWPEECFKCPLKAFCSSCIAIPYEMDENPKVFLDKMNMCGWTFAQHFAKRYYKQRIDEKYKNEGK